MPNGRKRIREQFESEAEGSAGSSIGGLERHTHYVAGPYAWGHAYLHKPAEGMADDKDVHLIADVSERIRQ